MISADWDGKAAREARRTLLAFEPGHADGAVAGGVPGAICQALLMQPVRRLARLDVFVLAPLAQFGQQQHQALCLVGRHGVAPTGIARPAKPRIELGKQLAAEQGRVGLPRWPCQHARQRQLGRELLEIGRAHV